MLQREAEHEIEAYLNSDEKKCLLVRGARQVGKTFTIRKAGQEWAKSYIEINFLESPGMKDIFSGDLDMNTLLLNFSLYLPEKKFIPGATVLFLDEIQECPEAVTSLKFWAADGRFRVIASGSMLGLDYKRPGSYPVGSIHYLDMYPLRFQEFLLNMGTGAQVMDVLRHSFATAEPVPEAVHKRVMQYFRLYMVIGGMPEVVQKWLDTRNMAAVDERQRALLTDYRHDIAHYAPPAEKIKAEACYFSLPDQLSKENHKFQYSAVEKGGTARKFGNTLEWLVSADLVRLCRNVTTPEFPLKSFVQKGQFRVYPGDIGLLIAMYDYSVKTALVSEDQESRTLGQAKGGLYEALIADCLIKNGHKELYYYKNETAKLEIEFLLPSADGVLPVEVKAGNNRSRSLDRVLQKGNLPRGYKLVAGNAGRTDNKITLPLYMAMFL